LRSPSAGDAKLYTCISQCETLYNEIEKIIVFAFGVAKGARRAAEEPA
jgi:hypothetical protein